MNRQPIQVSADRYHVGTNNVIVKNTGTGTQVSIQTIVKNDTNGNPNGDIKTHDEVVINAPEGY